MENRNIIMNYTVAPSLDDMEMIALSLMETLPDEILRHCEDLGILVEDMVDEVIEQDLDLSDPFELLALYKSGKEISPGVELKNAENEDVLILFRRSILDVWCETGDDLGNLIRQVMIEEIARNFDFNEDDINEMLLRHFQGML